MTSIEVAQAKLDIINEYQCPGCMCGLNTGACESFKLLEENKHFRCDGHYPGTILLGVGNLYLGLPKGFCRTIPVKEFDGEIVHDPYIRLYTEGTFDYNMFNKFNVPVWAMEKDGFLLVRTYCPRISRQYLDVIQGGKLADIPKEFNIIDVSQFYDEID